MQAINPSYHTPKLYLFRSLHFKLTFSIILLTPILLCGQFILNDEVNYSLVIHEVNYYNNGNEGRDGPEPAWEFSWSLSAPSNSTCNSDAPLTQGGNSTALCITAPDEKRHTVDIIVTRQYGKDADELLYWKMRGWENDDFSSDNYCTDDFGDDERHCSSGSITMALVGSLPGIEQELNEIGMGSSSWIPEIAWVYQNGHWNGDPLSFGTAQEGDTYRDVNSNKYTNTGLGYQNQFNLADAPYAPSAEVVYSLYFSSPKSARVSIQDNVNSSYIHILRKENSTYEYIETIEGNDPNTEKVFCEGLYYFVIEPKGAIQEHEFTFVIDNIQDFANPMVLDPGSITSSRKYFIRGKESVYSVYNQKAASYPNPEVSIDYRWSLTRLDIIDEFNDVIAVDDDINGDSSLIITESFDHDEVSFRRFSTALCYDSRSESIWFMGLASAEPINIEQDCLPKIIGNNNLDETSIISGIYKSAFLVGHGSVDQSSTVLTQVQDSMLLESGFEVQLGAEFEIEMKTCDILNP